MLNSAYLERLIINQYAFALFRQPGKDTIDFILQKQQIPNQIYDYQELNHTHGFVIAPFSLSTTTPCVMIAADITAQGEQAIQQTLEQFCQHYCPTTVN